MKITDLNPCPFCGGAADFCDTGVFWVRCNECGADGQAGDTMEEAVSLWNRRAALAVQTQQGVEVKKLEATRVQEAIDGLVETDTLLVHRGEKLVGTPLSGVRDAVRSAIAVLRSALVDVPAVESEPVASLQDRVQPWMTACFGPEISADKLERNDRFMEEALELVQASDYPKDRVLALVDYVYERDQGEINQEVGGVMITLAAHCLAHGVDMHKAGETELARIWTKVETIRAKQAAKPTGSALPVAHPPRSLSNEGSETAELIARLTREIVGIRSRSPREVFSIMTDRIRLALSTRKGSAGDGAATGTKGVSE